MVLFIVFYTLFIMSFDLSQEGITWEWKEGTNFQGMKIRYQSKINTGYYVPVRGARFANDGIICRGAY